MRVMCLCLSVCACFCVSVSADVNRLETIEQVAEVHERIRASFSALEKGFSYNATATNRSLAIGTRGMLNGRQRLVKIESLPKPEVTTASIELTGVDDGYVIVVGAGSASRKLQATRDKLFAFTPEGVAFKSVPRTPEEEENLIRFSYFAPHSAWDDWLGFPWPAKAVDANRVDSSKVLSSDDNKCVVRVDASYLNGDQRVATYRLITYRRSPEIGWMPERFESYIASQPEPRKVEEVQWGLVGSANILIPTRYQYVGYVRNPANGDRVANQERVFEIDREDFRLSHDVASAIHIDTIKAGAPPVTPPPMPQGHLDVEAARMSPYLIAFAAFLVVGFVLWRVQQKGAVSNA